MNCMQLFLGVVNILAGAHAQWDIQIKIDKAIQVFIERIHSLLWLIWMWQNEINKTNGWTLSAIDFRKHYRTFVK